MLWVEVDHLEQVELRRIKVTKVAERHPEIVVGIGVGRFDGHEGLQERDRVAQLALVQQRERVVKQIPCGPLWVPR